MVGRVANILLPEKNQVLSSHSRRVIVVETFEISEALHFKLGMPVLLPPTENSPKYVVVPSSV